MSILSQQFNFLYDPAFNEKGLPHIDGTIQEDPSIIDRLQFTLPDKRDNRSNIDYKKDTNILFNEDSEIFVEFIDEHAGYNNVIGYYMYQLYEEFGNKPTIVVNGTRRLMTRADINTDDSRDRKNILNRTIIFPNFKRVTDKGVLSLGNYVNLKPFGDFAYSEKKFKKGTGIGFFVIPDGWDSEKKTIKTNVMSSILYSDANFNVNNTYPNGIAQSVMLIDEFKSSSKNYSFIMAFDDIMLPGGDKDYNDLVLRINCTSSFGNYSQLSAGRKINENHLVADESGVYIEFTSDAIKKMKECECEAYRVKHTIISDDNDKATHLYNVFSKINFSSVVYEPLLSVEDNSLIFNFIFKKEDISTYMYIYKSVDNQTETLDDHKNIYYIQLDYIFVEPEDNNIREFIEINVCSCDKIIINNGETYKIIARNCSSPTSQGDPHITTFKGVNYLAPFDERVLEMYNNGELLIKTSMKRYAPYANSKNAMLRDSTFMEKTMIRTPYGRIIINNFTLDIIFESVKDISKIRIYPIDKVIANDKYKSNYKQYSFRFIEISTSKLGWTVLKFCSIPAQYDLLNDFTICNPNMFTMVPATGAFVSEHGLSWSDQLTF